MGNVIEFRRPQQVPAHAAQAEPARRTMGADDCRAHVLGTILALLEIAFNQVPEWALEQLNDLYCHDGISGEEYDLLLGHFYPRGAA